MIHEGLAGLGQQYPEAPQGKQISLEQVVQMLQQGIDPQTLVAQGIPKELVMEAAKIVLQQLESTGAQGGLPPHAPSPDQGLAFS